MKTGRSRQFGPADRSVFNETDAQNTVSGGSVRNNEMEVIKVRVLGVSKNNVYPEPLGTWGKASLGILDVRICAFRDFSLKYFF